MKKQVVFIHGGEAYSQYDAFLEHLRTCEIDPLAKPSSRWHKNLSEDLGSDFEVFSPRMPNTENAKYLEWKLWFERFIPLLKDGVVLIGHSLGGYFLVKYLLEEQFPVSIKALYLVATPFEPDTNGLEDGGDFHFEHGNVPKLAQMAQNIVIVHSADDFVVSVDHAYHYKEALPEAKFLLFQDRLHFWQESFPELITDIQSHF